MNLRLRFILRRIGERLWVKPLVMCVFAVSGAFIARSADFAGLGEFVPDITAESVTSLLSIMSGSMLVIATFAVASMVSAYASAGSTATPRSFPLVIADDVSQNALSAFIGAFIFSIISLIAMENSYYDKSGRFTLFVLTLTVFAVVILTFVRWVDQVARLGRLGTTIDKVETATAIALERRRSAPILGGTSVKRRPEGAQPVYSENIGYVVFIEIAALQSYAEETNTRIEVAALPGTFSGPGRALAYITADSGNVDQVDTSQIEKAFSIGEDRTYDEDPRFGLIVLSEIASRALSPGINDPGTAIDVIGTLVRLFSAWGKQEEEQGALEIIYDRVAVPELSLQDMFDDAFRAIARDGAGTIEVVVRLQKAFKSLASINDLNMRAAAKRSARLAFIRAEESLTIPEDIEMARESARSLMDAL